MQSKAQGTARTSTLKDPPLERGENYFRLRDATPESAPGLARNDEAFFGLAGGDASIFSDMLREAIASRVSTKA